MRRAGAQQPPNVIASPSEPRLRAEHRVVQFFLFSEDSVMATDYDAPRSTARDELVDNPGPLVGVVGNDARSGAVDEIDTAESVELPGADLSGEQLTVRVVPQQADEFRCSSCFLVQHRHRYAGQRHEQPICADCAT